MKLDSLKQRIEDLQSVARSGWIPTTDANGARAWIKDGGCGIRFMYHVIKWERDGGELTADMKEKLELWSRVEDDGKHGQIVQANKQMARRILGHS